jgi:aminopeptidase N
LNESRTGEGVVASCRPTFAPGLIARLVSCAWLALAAACTAAQGRGGGGFVDVVHYSAAIRVDVERAAVRGTVFVHLVAPIGESAAVTLDAGELEIDAVTDGRRRIEFTKESSRLSLTLEPAQERQRFVRIDYHGVPPRGLRVVAASGQVSTAFATSEWMPCVDAPGERATFDVSLVAPRGHETVASGHLLGARNTPDGVATRWVLDEPVPSYLLGFATGPFREAVARAGPVELRYLGPRSFSAGQLRQVFATAPDMLAFFERVSGVPYPHRSYTQVLLEGGSGQEMAGFSVMGVGYGERVLADPTNVWLGAHELAHQWWGNAVTNESWNHFWLNEGIATFMTAAYLEQRFGRGAYLAQIDAARAKYEALRDAGKDHALVFADWTKPTADDRSIVYDKGAYVVHLLREELGEESFWAGLRSYTESNWGRSVATPDFEASMERASGRDLDAFFARWVYTAAGGVE